MGERARPILYVRGRVFATEHVPIATNSVVLDGDFELHSHDFMEIVLITKGDGMHLTAHGRQPLGYGDAIVLQPGAWHAYLECRDLEVTNCCFGADLLQRELAWMHEDPSLYQLLHAGPRAVGRRGILPLRVPQSALTGCLCYLDDLQRRMATAGFGNKAAPLGLLVLVLAELAQAVQQGNQVAAPQHPLRLHEAVARGLRLLEEDIAHQWSLPELANRLHVDRAYLVRLFKAGTGLPPMAYLARLRAERAATLAVETDLPLSEIGRVAGWPDPNYFARRFKAHFGMSATAYRTRYAATQARPDQTHHAEAAEAR